MREGTRKILEQEEDMVVVAEASDGEEAVRLTMALKPDLAIIDITMPILDGIEATRQIKEICPATTILILTAYDDDQFIFSLLEAGAAGYLLKNVSDRELTDAVRAIYAGESVLHPSITRKVINRFASISSKLNEKQTFDTLSERELDILKLATTGLNNQDIAERLNISIRTVQGHLGRIFNKLNVSSRTEAVLHALKKGWITLDDVS